MKILQVLPALEQGGVERGTLEIASALVQAGVPNAVASSGGRLEAELEALGVEHIRLNLATKNPFAIRRNGSALAEIVRKGGFTLMHVRSRAPAWSVRRASRLSGVFRKAPVLVPCQVAEHFAVIQIVSVDNRIGAGQILLAA